LAKEYDPTDVDAALTQIRDHQKRGEVVTGLLYINENKPEMHEIMQTIDTPLVDVPFVELCPGSAALEQIQEKLR